MTRVREIMTRDVHALDPEMTLREASELLSRRGISGAPVVAGTTLVGVLSRTDLLEFQSTEGGVPVERTDQTEREEWRPAARWEENAAEEPSAYFVDLWDDAGADVFERMQDPEGPEWDLLEEHRVSEVMTRQVVSVSPDESVREAARIMSSQGIHRVLVLGESGRLEGILTTTDLIRGLADGQIPGEAAGG